MVPYCAIYIVGCYFPYFFSLSLFLSLKIVKVTRAQEGEIESAQKNGNILLPKKTVEEEIDKVEAEIKKKTRERQSAIWSTTLVFVLSFVDDVVSSSSEKCVCACVFTVCNILSSQNRCYSRCLSSVFRARILLLHLVIIIVIRRREKTFPNAYLL